MKQKFLPVVLCLAMGGILLGGCVKNEESEGVLAVRNGYANRLNADAELVLAAAEHERADAAYRLAETQLKEAEVALQLINNRIQEVNAKVAEGSLDAQLEAKLKALELEKAGLEADIMDATARLKNAEASVATAEAALANAQRQMLEAQESLKLAEFDALYEQLFTTPGYYDLRNTKVGELETAYGDLVALSVAPPVEQQAVLELDVLNAKNNVDRVKALQTTYGTLAGKDIDALRDEADAGEQEWRRLQTVEQAASVTREKALQARDNEQIKWNNYREQIFGSASYIYRGTDPMASATANVANAGTFSVSGLKNAVDFANTRLAYLKNTDLQHSLDNGYQYATSTVGTAASTVANATNPSKQWITNELDRVNAELDNLNNYILVDQKLLTDARETDFKNAKIGTVTWTAAKTAYETQVRAVNNAVNTFRGNAPANSSATMAVNTIADWKARLAAGGMAPDGSSETVTTTFANNFKAYMVARLSLDMPAFITNWSSLTSAAEAATSLTISNGNAFDVLSRYLGSVPAATFTSMLNADLSTFDFNGSSDVSDLRIIEYYENAGYKASNPNTHAAAPSAAEIRRVAVTVQLNDEDASSTDYDYFHKTKVGMLLQLSANVYGADDLTDMEILPYTVEPNSVTDLPNYSTSLFGLWWNEKETYEALLTGRNGLEKDVADYTALLAACNKSIDELTRFLGVYQPKLTDAQTAYDAQTPKYETAVLAYVEAQAALVDAQKKTADAKDLYDLLRDETTNDLVSAIEGELEHLETLLGDANSGYIQELDGANQALHAYNETTNKNEVALTAKRKQIDILVQEIDDLNTLIASLQARMKALIPAN